MLTLVRRHPILGSLATLGLLVVLGLGAGWWYLFGEERRSGLLVSRLLSERLGIEVRVKRAQVDGPRRLILRDVRVPPGAHWTGDVRVRELRVDGGVMPILRPRGRALSVVLVSTSVALSEQKTPLTPPTVQTLETIRRLVMQLLEWPAAVSIRIEGGELRSGADTLAFDLQGEKTAAGVLDASLSVSRPGEPPALRLTLAGKAAGGQVAVHLGVEGEPLKLGAMWPGTLPAITRLGVQADGRLGAGGALQLSGRAQVERAASSPLLAVEFTSSYAAARARLDLSRLALDWGKGVHLEGTGAAELPDGVPRVALDLAGAVDGTPLKLTAGYTGGTGTISAKIDAGPVSARRLMARAGFGAPPTELTARRVRSTLDGRLESDGRAGRSRMRVAVGLDFDGLQAPAYLLDLAFDGSLRGDAVLRRGDAGLELAALGPTTLTLARQAAPVLVATAHSRGEAAWPLAVEATLPDLRRLPPYSSLPASLTGRAVARGTLDRSGFSGSLTADLPRVEVRFQHPIVVKNARAAIPVNLGTPPAAQPGTFSVERIEAYGFGLDRLTSAARFDEGRLLLSEIQYTHYGGRGGGRIEAAIDRRPLPLRARIEGEHVDLAVLAREYGLTVAQLSGKVRYLLVSQHSTAHGLTVIGQVNSEEGGGEIGIDAIEKLIRSERVQGDTTGLLRQTLESLRVFRYSSLDADVRVTREGGRINLSLEGKKRLGLFPPPVKAINFSNVPLDLLVRTFGTFGRKETP